MTSPRYSPTTTPAVQWPLVLGLGSMALLWPLTALTGVGGTGAPRALGIVGLTALVWIGVVGFGRVARPVLTLTLAGLVFGLVATAMSFAFGGVGLPGENAAAWTVIPALAVDSLWGFVAGLIALAVQNARGEAR